MKKITDKMMIDFLEKRKRTGTGWGVLTFGTIGKSVRSDLRGAIRSEAKQRRAGK